MKGVGFMQCCLEGVPSSPKLRSPQSRTWGLDSKAVTVLNVSRTILQGARTHSAFLSLVQGDLLVFPQVPGLWSRKGNGDHAAPFRSLQASALKAEGFLLYFRLEKPMKSSNLTYGSRMHCCAFNNLPRCSLPSCLAGGGGYEREISLKWHLRPQVLN